MPSLTLIWNGGEIEGFSKVVSKDETVRNDYNLSPSRYVAIDNGEEVMPLEEALVELAEAEEDRAEADRQLREVLKSLGLSLSTPSIQESP